MATRNQTRPERQVKLAKKSDVIEVMEPANSAAGKIEEQKAVAVIPPVEANSVVEYGDFGKFDTYTVERPEDAPIKSAIQAQSSINPKHLNALIESIRQRRKDLEQDIHYAACLCVVYALQNNGDVKPAMKLLQAIGSEAKGKSATAVRTNALKAWFVKDQVFVWDATPVIDHTSGKLLADAKGLKVGPGFGHAKIEQAKSPLEFGSNLMKTPFYMFNQEREYEAFILMNEFEAFLKRAENKIKNPEMAGKVSDAGLTRLRALFYGDPELMVAKVQARIDAKAAESGKPIILSNASKEVAAQTETPLQKAA